MAGYLVTRLPDAGLDEVPDPSRGRTKWKLAQLLTGVVVGMMAGCKDLRDVEQLTELLSPAIRRKLKLGGRQPDTSLRDVLCELSLDELRGCLQRAVKTASRRKALEPQGLPFGVLSLDGKCTSLPYWDSEYVQRHQPEQGLPFGIVRTVTCTLTSAAGRPCVDAVPIPASTNEMGHFRAVLDSVLSSYSTLFRVVTYDAGALSEENARAIVEAGKAYVLRLKGEQRYMYRLAEELLDPNDVVASTVDVLDNRTTLTRKLVRLKVQQNWAYGGGKASHESVWQHARSFLRVESIKARDGVVIEHELRMYVSSLNVDELTGEQWLRLIRGHWGVETNHQILDTAFEEDDRLWIVANACGLLNVLMLRRLAYTLMTLYRSVTQRSDDERQVRWRDLMTRFLAALLGATENHLANLRPRSTAAVWS